MSSFIQVSSNFGLKVFSCLFSPALRTVWIVSEKDFLPSERGSFLTTWQKFFKVLRKLLYIHNWGFKSLVRNIFLKRSCNPFTCHLPRSVKKPHAAQRLTPTQQHATHSPSTPGVCVCSHPCKLWPCSARVPTYQTAWQAEMRCEIRCDLVCNADGERPQIPPPAHRL